MELTALVPTYRGDDPSDLRRALRSLLDGTRPPDELLVVEDGPLTDLLTATLESVRATDPEVVRTVKLETNRGLGAALRHGMEAATGEYVARMDADDIAVPDRLERQESYLQSNPNVDILGGYIEEFKNDPKEPYAVRTVPLDHDNICAHARRRSPFNHGSVIVQRSAVLEAGNYRAVDRMEDWDLWARLLANGARGANVPSVLVRCQAGPDMYRRRGGTEYAREELRQQVEFLRSGFVGRVGCLRNLITRVPFRLLPDQLRGYLYRSQFRRSSDFPENVTE